MKNLDVSQEEFKALLDKSTQMVLEQYKNISQRKGFHSFPQQEVEKWFDEPLPQKGMHRDALLSFVESKVLNTATGNMGPNMYAYVVAGGNQMGIVAEKLAATINQNVAKWHLAPQIVEIEKRVVQWIGKMIGFAEKAGGILVSGGSAANFSGLTVARNIFFEKAAIREKGMFGQKPFIVYASDEVHNSVDKSIQILGIGSAHLKKIATDAQFKIDIKQLKEQIEKDKAAGLTPFCVIGNAGTVNTGAIDDLDGLADVAKAHNMWFHIDGAYGGLIASIKEKKTLYKGLERADSVALDFHKWLYQPFEVGAVLVKDWQRLKRTYFANASYLESGQEKTSNRLEINEHTFQLSRNAKALKVWMSLKYYGIEKLQAMMRKDLNLTQYLEQMVEHDNDFKLIATSPLAICCFQYKKGMDSEAEIEQFNQQLVEELEKDGRVFITGTRLKGIFVLRACIINHRKQKKDIEYLVSVIKDVAKNNM